MQAQRPDHPHVIVGMQPARHRGRRVGEARVEHLSALAGGEARQLGAERRVGRRGGVESPHQRADVKPGAADHHRQASARANRVDGRPRLTGEACRVVRVVGLDGVDQMMRHDRALLGRRLARGDVHPAIDLARVGRHDLDGQTRAERHGGGSLADTGGPRDDEQRRIGHC